MNFDLTEEQEMVRDTFARFLDENSSSTRVRAAMPSGFDPALWQGLAELGALSLRVPEEAGGLGLGLFDAAILMEEAGRTLASGPLAEALVAARLLAQLGGTGYAARGAVSSAGEVARTKRMLRRAFECQLAGKGFSFVEILTMCPTGWFLPTAQGPEYLNRVLGGVHVVGELKREGRFVPTSQLPPPSARA